MTEYVTTAEYRRQKSALTRAINSKDPLKVLVAVEKTLEAWSGKAWPDGWSRWRVALDDAWRAYEIVQELDGLDDEVLARFRAAYDRF